MLARWSPASPALQAALATPLASRLDTFCQLRYRPGRPGPHPRPRPGRRARPGPAIAAMAGLGAAPDAPLRLRLPPLPDRARRDARRRNGPRRRLPHRPRNCSACTPSPATGSPASPPGCAGTASWNRLRPRSASSPASWISTAPRSTTPAGGGCGASPRPSSTSPAGAASSTSSPTQRPGQPPPQPHGPARRPGPGTPRPAPPDRAAHRHPPLLPARAAAAARTRGRDYAEFVFTLPEPMAGFPAPAGQLPAQPRRHQRTRHLGTALQLGHRHHLARTPPRDIGPNHGTSP